MPSKILKIVTSKKAMPWVIGAAVIIGGIVLFMLMQGGSGASASSGAGASAGGPSEALQAAQLQASTQIALGAQAANVQTTQFATELQGLMYSKDSDLALAGLQAQVANATTGAQTQVSLANIDAQKQVALSSNETQRFGIAQQFNYMNNQTNAQFDYLALQSSNQTAIDISRIGSDERTAQLQAKTAKSIANTQAVGNIIGGIIGAFSDVRLKKNISWTGNAMERNPAGRGFVEYGKYNWDWKSGGAGHGALAQEMMIVKPEAVTKYRRGRMMLNYEAVA